MNSILLFMHQTIQRPYLSISSSTISINGINYPVNGYNNLTIGPTNITYILQNLKILSGTTSANQTYTIITTIQGI